MKILSVEKTQEIVGRWKVFPIEIYKVTCQTGTFFKKTHVVMIAKDFLLWRHVSDWRIDHDMGRAIRDFQKAEEKKKLFDDYSEVEREHFELVKKNLIKEV